MSEIPGMKPGHTARNVILGFLYLAWFPLVVGIFVALNTNGLADRLDSIPGIEAGGGFRSGMLSFLYVLIAFSVISTAGGTGEDTNSSNTTGTMDATTSAQDNSNNILSVSIKDSNSNREGTVFLAFQVKIRADTILKDADSGEDDYGEPLFIVEIDGEEVAEVKDVERKSNGLYTIDIHQDATESFSKGDTFELTVILYDEDTFSDDRIDSITKTVEYGEQKTTTTTTSEPGITVNTPDSDSKTPTTEETTSTTTETTIESMETTTTSSEDDYYTNILEIGFASKGIYVESIEISNGRANGGNKAVVVEYSSTATSTGELAYEIGGFTGAFTSVVKDGWDIDVMVVHIQELDGDPAVTIYIREKWVQSYLRGEITEDELLSKVIESGVTH